MHRVCPAQAPARESYSFCLPMVFRRGDTPESADVGADGQESDGSFVDRMLEVLRRSPICNWAATRNFRSRTSDLRPGHFRYPPKLSSQMEQTATSRSYSEPENGAVSEKLVFEAAKEAAGKSYKHLYVIGFAIQPNARNLIDNCEAAMSIPATYVQATPDLMMGDLLKDDALQPDFQRLRPARGQAAQAQGQRQRRVAIRGRAARRRCLRSDRDEARGIALATTFPPGCSIPTTTAYASTCRRRSFRAPAPGTTSKKHCEGTYDEAVWDHLAGTTSAPFEAGDQRQIAVKVLDDRGNELMVVKSLSGGG